jgi:hypothetical protein
MMSPGTKSETLGIPVMAGQAETTQVAEFGEDRKLRKQNESRI